MLKRIDLDKYKKETVPSVGGGAITGSIREVMCDSMEIQNVLQLVKEKTTVLWVSDGRWSMHQLLMGLLDITGAAKVYISTYALSETPTRILVQLKEMGLITDLYAVIDNRVDTRTANTLQIIKKISTKYSLIDTHAKVTVIVNNEWTVSVVGSANYTENKRYECGTIYCTTEAAQHMLQWINKALADGNQ